MFTALPKLLEPSRPSSMVEPPAVTTLSRLTPNACGAKDPASLLLLPAAKINRTFACEEKTSEKVFKARRLNTDSPPELKFITLAFSPDNSKMLFIEEYRVVTPKPPKSILRLSRAYVKLFTPLTTPLICGKN